MSLYDLPRSTPGFHGRLNATIPVLMGQSATWLVQVTFGTGGNITSATPAAATISMDAHLLWGKVRAGDPILFRISRRTKAIEPRHESHPDKANRWAGSSPTGGLACPTTQAQ